MLRRCCLVAEFLSDNFEFPSFSVIEGEKINLDFKATKILFLVQLDCLWYVIQQGGERCSLVHSARRDQFGL